MLEGRSPKKFVQYFKCGGGGGTGFRGTAAVTGEWEQNLWARGAPEVETVRKDVVIRGEVVDVDGFVSWVVEVASADGLAPGAGEAAEGDGLA